MENTLNTEISKQNEQLQYIEQRKKNYAMNETIYDR